MPYLDLDSVRLFFTDDGSGAVPLVLLHGLSADASDWSWVTPLLRGKYRIVGLDLRGHGYSGGGAGYALADFASDVLHVADNLGCQRFVPVGHSLGGAIAARLAVEHADRVAAVVEVDPAYALPPFIVGMWEAGRARWLALQRGEPVGPEPRPPYPPFMPPFLPTLLERRHEAMDPVVNWACYTGLADGPERMFAASPEANDYLRRRECPVLSIHSLPGRAAWESALFSHQASHAIEWEGSSHFLHIERYRELAAVITGWLDPLMASGAAAVPAGQES